MKAEDFLGTWETKWNSPTGEYNADLVIDHLLPLPGGSYDAGGYYVGGDGGKGVVSGTVIEGYTLIKTAIFRGKWHRVPGPSGGSSGGQCQYGFFGLSLTSPDLFEGRWNYCNDDLINHGWSWLGRRRLSPP